MLKRAHRLPPDLRHAVIGCLQAATDHHGLIELGQYGVALHVSARTDGLPPQALPVAHVPPANSDRSCRGRRRRVF